MRNLTADELDAISAEIGMIDDAFEEYTNAILVAESSVPSTMSPIELIKAEAARDGLRTQRGTLQRYLDRGRALLERAEKKSDDVTNWTDILRYLDTYGGSYTYGRRDHMDDDTFSRLQEQAKGHGLTVNVSPGGNVHVMR